MIERTSSFSLKIGQLVVSETTNNDEGMIRAIEALEENFRAARGCAIRRGIALKPYRDMTLEDLDEAERMFEEILKNEM